MGATHCRCHGFIIVLVMFLSSISCLPSKLDVYYDARGIKIEVGLKQNLYDSIPNPRSDFGSSLPTLANQIPVCRHQNRSRAPVLIFDCKEKGYVFTKINFADYGHASGDCGNFRRGNCGAPDTLRLVKKNCLRKWQCVLLLGRGDEMFGPTHCKSPPWFVVEATCTKT
ncbi:PREDICTED: beta-galactosidase 11 [Camelina sativa]|uniref:Beta-galactosidase 11 n=1 Tax=Camelina sativa TaxID=90675 RepID=A0ABM0SL18_CAMSA|nr:PREDICTED: beta-galactosidase 11 [Camelina sativa]